jgi:predicted phage-related endonuclease
MSTAVAVEVGSEEWLRTITPSKVPVILGVSRFDSPYRLWHRMTGRVAPEPENDRFDMGHDFEPAMAAMWKRRNPDWQLSPGEVQLPVPAMRFGFPALTTLDRRARKGRARKVVQFKTVRDMDEWGEYDTDEAPAYVVAQVITEMAFSGYTAHPASVLALGPFYERPRLFNIPFQPRLWATILPRLQEWHDSMRLAEPPDLDDTVATYDCLRQLHPDIEEGAEVLLEPADAERVRIAHANHELAKAQLQADKNWLLDTMGKAQYAKVGTDVVARRQRGSHGSVSLVIPKPKAPKAMAS